MKISASKPLPSSLVQFILFVPQSQTFAIPDVELQRLAVEAVFANKFSGKKDELVPLIKGEKVCLLAGLGDKPETVNMRQMGLLAKNALQSKHLDVNKTVGLIPLYDAEAHIKAIVDGAKLGLYKWDKYIAKKENEIDYSSLDILIDTQYAALAEREAAICDGVNLARDLGNENADAADSVFLEKTILDIVKDDPRCAVEILNRKELEEKGLRLHLAVNQGSAKEPKLIIAAYKGGKDGDPFISLVGKGITFDSGGLNLKTTSSMVDMRLDMCGAAAVIGTLRNALQLNLKRNVYFVCGLAENAIGPKAYKPGDVVVGYCGKSVEILNTDAEGRLVLADALSYMARNYKPDALIDIATLTGAVVVALGYEYAGLMASDDDLANRLLAAAEATDDRAWRLPIYPELQEHVKSQFADIKNIGQPSCAGTISGGEFLRQFAQCDSESQKWAHLDIGGTGTLEKDLAYFKVGASGAGVRLFTEFLSR